MDRKTNKKSRAWGTHVWVRARGVAFEIADEPLEAWFEAMHPVWSRQLAARVFRRALRQRAYSSSRSRSRRHGSDSISSSSTKNGKAGGAAGAGEWGMGADEPDAGGPAAAEKEDDQEDARCGGVRVPVTRGVWLSCRVRGLGVYVPLEGSTDGAATGVGGGGYRGAVVNYTSTSTRRTCSCAGSSGCERSENFTSSSGLLLWQVVWRHH